MKLFKVFFILVLVLMIFNWIARDHPSMGLGDILPFSRSGHSFEYNYAAIVLIGIAIWAVWRIYGRRGTRL
jgi:hypothetical protein